MNANLQQLLDRWLPKRYPQWWTLRQADSPGEFAERLVAEIRSGQMPHAISALGKVPACRRENFIDQYLRVAVASGRLSEQSFQQLVTAVRRRPGQRACFHQST